MENDYAARLSFAARVESEMPGSKSEAAAPPAMGSASVTGGCNGRIPMAFGL
jgi:hypothetical protein